MGGRRLGGGELEWSWDYEAKPLHPLPEGWEVAMGPALHSDLCPAVLVYEVLSSSHYLI